MMRIVRSRVRLKRIHKGSCFYLIAAPKRARKQAVLKVEADSLTGCQIAAFLGHPAAVVRRWASEGMPGRRQGRFVTTMPQELNAWLGSESRKPAHVATQDTDLAAELNRGLAFVRHDKAQCRQETGSTAEKGQTSMKRKKFAEQQCPTD